MIAFFLSLDRVPICKTVQSGVGKSVGKFKIKIGGIEFLVDLCVDEGSHFFV